jgi:exodeoxyribonuclease VII large subunit
MRRQVVNRRLQVDEEAEILQRRLRRYLNERTQQVRLNSSRLMLLSPRRFLVGIRGHLEQLGQRFSNGWQRCQQTRRRHLEYCRSHLDKLNPLAILARGYAVATRLPEETVIRDASLVPLGAPVRVRVARGRLDCEVQEVSSEQ